MTNELMYGKWYRKNEIDSSNVLEYDLSVGRETTQFSVKKNGERIKYDEFPSNGLHWMGRFLYYIDTQKYFIEKATETEIVFGELSNLGNFNGEYEIREVLKRVG